MYKRTNQLSIDDFIFPYGTLSPDNRWVRLAELIDWERVEREYATHFVNNGAPAHPARMALGALIAKQVLDCSDRELVSQVAENPYLQFFLGMKEYSDKCPFGASTLVAFRCRFSAEDVIRINDWVIDRALAVEVDESDDDEGDDSVGAGNDAGGGGGDSDNNSNDDDSVTLCLDATVAPSNIRYPTDTSLLAEAREKLEAIIDDLHSQISGIKPRTYRKVARKDYLNYSKSKKKTAKATRKARAKQLGYVRRDLGHIECLLEKGASLDIKHWAVLDTITTLYDQQLYMHTERVNSVSDRIVSIEQPWVRPMVRGKTARNTEFGAKVHVETEEGYVRIISLSFDAFNEAEGLIDALEDFKGRRGFYPTRVCVDKIYRSRKNLAWCKERGIAISGPKLGRPPKDSFLTKEQKAQEYEDLCTRNVVEGVFGTAKTTYGMDPVMTRLENTTETVIALALLAFNLKKFLKASLRMVSETVMRVFRWLFGVGTDAHHRLVLAAD